MTGSSLSSRSDLPAWGPYSPRHSGISHVPDVDGMRFDVSVFPSVFRGTCRVPSARAPYDFWPWEAGPDLAYHMWRHEVGPARAVIAFTLREQGVWMRAELTGKEDAAESLALHLLATLDVPRLHGERLRILGRPDGWIDALAYRALSQKRGHGGPVTDHWRRGEIRDHGLVDGRALRLEEGDEATWEIELERETCLSVRCRCKEPARVRIEETEWILSSSERGADLSLGGRLGRQRIVVVCLSGTVDVEGFPLGQPGPRVERAWPLIPEIEQNEDGAILRMEGLPPYFLAWPGHAARLRRFYADEVDSLLPAAVHDHATGEFWGKGEGHFLDVVLGPFHLQPGQAEVVHAWVGCGPPPTEDPEDAWRAGRAGRARIAESPFRAAVERLAATVCSNVVYPVYSDRRYLKAETPGRWWPSLYTWDAGFIGLGMLELDPARTLAVLEAYLTEPGAQSPFVHHGSMVPVQFALFLELWNRSGDEAMLRRVHPRLVQYYEFYVGRGHDSRTRQASGLLSTLPYFYNSGGWDDYPAQAYVHEHGLAEAFAPVISTAQGILCARIMALAARHLGLSDEVYQADEQALGSALVWERPVFCWASSDRILRHPSGANFNLGMDGVSPLVAGVGSAEQTAAMVDFLMEGLWTPIGLTAVAPSAPYFRPDGYWNGTVWMAHQWYFWKAMLDLGETDSAWRIAHTALTVWAQEAARSGNCPEHFLLATGRGAGWPHFGGLSAPVLSWHAALFSPGTLTLGLDAWVIESRRSETRIEAHIRFSPRESEARAMLACMAPGGSWTVTWNGRAVPAVERMPGLLEIRVPADAEGRLAVKRQEGQRRGDPV
jgi:hypothetical protein